MVSPSWFRSRSSPSPPCSIPVPVLCWRHKGKEGSVPTIPEVPLGQGSPRRPVYNTTGDTHQQRGAAPMTTTEPGTTRTAYTTCPLCEATCGLEITTRGRDVLSIRGDQADVFSQGYICPKAY